MIKMENKIGLLTSISVFAAILALIFLIVEISQEKKLYLLELRIKMLEDLVLDNRFKNTGFENVGYLYDGSRDNSIYQRAGHIMNIVSNMDMTLSRIHDVYVGGNLYNRNYGNINVSPQNIVFMYDRDFKTNYMYEVITLLRQIEQNTSYIRFK